VSEFLATALQYVARRWRVFPLVPRTKRPATQHGVADATTDAEILRAWWSRSPAAGVAIATGACSGLVVLDVDPRSGGDESLIELEERFGPLPETAISLTGGGGTHYLFAHPGIHVPNRTALGGLTGLDLKGDGGYVCAPPSLHPNGRVYVWNVMAHPDDVPLAPCPSVLLRLADARRESPRRSYTGGRWDGRTPARAQYLIWCDARVRSRFRRSTERLRDTSPSGVDFALAAMLAFRKFSGAEIEATIRASRAQANLPERPTSYYVATVGKALGGVVHAA